MNFPDIWATVTGIAGILSLFLAINNKYANWKKYTVPVCVGLVGFAIGRLTVVITPMTGNLPSENFSIMVLVFILLMVALAVFYIAMKYDQPGLAYMGMLFLVIIALPKVFDHYSSTKSAIPSGDYLVLSKYKEKIGDYQSAVKYLQKYIDNNTDKELNDELKKMITELKRRQLADTKPIEFESKRMIVPTQKSSEGGHSP